MKTQNQVNDHGNRNHWRQHLYIPAGMGDCPSVIYKEAWVELQEIASCKTLKTSLFELLHLHLD